MSPLVTLLICSTHLPTWSRKLVIAAYCGYHPDKMGSNTISRNFNQWPPSQSQQNNLLLLQFDIYYKFLFKYIPIPKYSHYKQERNWERQICAHKHTCELHPSVLDYLHCISDQSVPIAPSCQGKWQYWKSITYNLHKQITLGMSILAVYHIAIGLPALYFLTC
jgi:hypothetical protein